MELKYLSLKINKNVLMQWVCQSLRHPDDVLEKHFGSIRNVCFNKLFENVTCVMCYW